MSEKTGLKQVIAEEVSEQVEVTDVLGDESIEDTVDGGEIGAAVGREFGETVGREFGESVGRNLHETIETTLEEDSEDVKLRTALVSAVREAVSDSLDQLGAGDSIDSIREGITESEDDESEGHSDDEKRTAEEDSDDEAASEGEATDDDKPTADETVPEGSAEGLDSDSLDGLRRETLEEFLATVSYSDLQSIAKDVGVKANLDQETMIDRIVDTVTGSDENEGDVATGEG